MTERKDTEISEDRSDPTRDQTEAAASPARRKLLRVLAGAGGVAAAGALLPEKWTQPLVNRVLIPAHAQATAVSYSGSGFPNLGALPGEGLGSRILNAVIPAANAGQGPGGQFTINVCIEGSGGSRTLTIASCCAVQSAKVDVQSSSIPKQKVGDCSVTAEFSGGVWLVAVTSVNFCPGEPILNGEGEYAWIAECGPGPCLGQPIVCDSVAL